MATYQHSTVADGDGGGGLGIAPGGNTGGEATVFESIGWLTASDVAIIAGMKEA